MPEDDAEAAFETTDSFDPARRLCPDGNCVGVLGGNGRCSVCGTRGGDDAPGLSPEAFGGGCMDDADVDVAAAPENDAGAFDTNRRLCPDGSCVGVIGANGVCGTCGRAADGA